MSLKEVSNWVKGYQELPFLFLTFLWLYQKNLWSTHIKIENKTKTNMKTGEEGPWVILIIEKTN